MMVSQDMPRYEIRYSEAPITSDNFVDASFMGKLSHKISGSIEQVRIDGLMPERQYYFAMVSEDEAGNTSPVSNLASVTTRASRKYQTFEPSKWVRRLWFWAGLPLVMTTTKDRQPVTICVMLLFDYIQEPFIRQSIP